MKGRALLRASRYITTLLPWPLGLVEYFNGHECNLSDVDGHWLLRLGDNYSSLLLPLGSLLAECTRVELIVALVLRVHLSGSELASDHVDHLVRELTESATSAPSVAAAVVGAAPTELSEVRVVAIFELFVVGI